MEYQKYLEKSIIKDQKHLKEFQFLNNSYQRNKSPTLEVDKVESRKSKYRYSPSPLLSGGRMTLGRNQILNRNNKSTTDLKNVPSNQIGNEVNKSRQSSFNLEKNAIVMKNQSIQSENFIKPSKQVGIQTDFQSHKEYMPNFNWGQNGMQRGIFKTPVFQSSPQVIIPNNFTSTYQEQYANLPGQLNKEYKQVQRGIGLKDLSQTIPKTIDSRWSYMIKDLWSTVDEVRKSSDYEPPVREVKVQKTKNISKDLK